MEVIRISEPNVLNFLSISINNAIAFLSIYTILFFEKNGLGKNLYNFFRNQINSSLNENKTINDYELNKLFENWKELWYLKSNITRPCIEGKKKKELELNRIWPKVINPLAFSLNKLGSIKLVCKKVLFTDLIYNKLNWRDKTKPKDLPRDWNKYENEKHDSSYKITKAKEITIVINEYANNALSEYINSKNECSQLHVHHIIPIKRNNKFESTLENLICITPSEHAMAHKGGNRKVDAKFQIDLLLSKLNTIKNCPSINLVDWNISYSLENFKQMLYSINSNYFNNLETFNVDQLIEIVKSYKDALENNC